MTKKKQKFEGKIEAITSSEPFYMVVVEEGIFPPKTKHLSYQDAFEECLRISKKENKKAYVMLSVTLVEQIPNVLQFNLVKL
jgi:hypothetical protein